MKVKAVRERDDRVILLFDADGEVARLCVSQALYYAVGSPRAGALLSSEVLDRLRAEDTEWRVVQKALSLLAASDKNRLALRRRLYECGFGREAVDMAVEYCVNLGYIDERRQLSILIEHEANRSLRGREYIKRKLMTKGYSASDIDAVTDRLVEEGEIDFVINFDTLCGKRGVSDPEQRRILAFKYGYRSSDM